MSKKDKLLDKALNNFSGLSSDDFCTLMLHQGWILDHQRGSHQISGIRRNRIGSLYKAEMGRPRVIK